MITLPVFNFMHFGLQTDSLMRIYSVLLTWESKKGRKIPTVIDSRWVAGTRHPKVLVDCGGGDDAAVRGRFLPVLIL